MEIYVNVGAHGDAPRARLEVAVRHTLASESRSGEISLTLVDDAEIARLNREYLGRDSATDVIAFSLGEDDAPLGDIYVCVDQAKRQAKQHGVSLDEELVRLAVHGTLHVLGHDHPEGSDRLASPMFQVQERLVKEVLKDAE